MTPGRLYVVDTNVVVAGVITGDTSSPVAQIADALVGGRMRFALSVELLAEYRDVLLRPKIRAIHGLAEREVDALLEAVVTNAMTVEVSGVAVEAPPDPGDAHLWQLLAAMPRPTLVTGDRLLIERAPAFATVVTPRQCVDAVHDG